MYSERLSFGKYRGQRWCDVPTSYLGWLLENVTDLQTRLKSAIVRELRSRGVVVEVPAHETCPICHRPPSLAAFDVPEKGPGRPGRGPPGEKGRSPPRGRRR
jgi:hypothetical protein